MYRDEEQSIVRSGLVVLIMVGVIIAGLTWGSFKLYEYYAPKRAEVQRNVFENTTSFNQGLIQELRNMQYEYVQASDEHKTALRSIILHRIAGYEEKLPDDLRLFIAELRR